MLSDRMAELREITLDDLESLAIGAWILGAGGGGNPYHHFLNMRELYRTGTRVRLMDPMDLADDPLVAPVSTMGAPLVGEERPEDPETCARPVRMMEAFLGRKCDAVMSLEIGGANSFHVAAMMGLPVADADCMGRAFPEAQVTSFAIGDLQNYPFALADIRDNAVIISRAASWKWMERIARKICTEVGSLAATCKAPRSGKEVKDWGVLNTATKAMRIGEYDGRPIVPFDEKAMGVAARRIRDKGLTSVAIASVFSPLNGTCEERAAEILKAEAPEVAVTLSGELGRIGLLGRENATLMNAAIIDLARRTPQSFVEALRASGIEAPLYLTQNDGTVMRAEYAERFPVYSFASGPTNSMRGAAFLSELEDAIVVDVGGTTTDIGCLEAGFPREANNVVEIGGIRTLFRMPDLLSIGLGGGTLIDPDSADIGPRSVGYRLTDEALVFGGDRLTATDVAVAAGLTELGDRSRLEGLDRGLVSQCRQKMESTIEVVVDRMKTDAEPLPLIAVGGGAFLVPGRVPGISEVVHVPHQGVANAVGAAIAQVSGEVDQVFSGLSRDEALAEAERIARERACDAGAGPIR